MVRLPWLGGNEDEEPVADADADEEPVADADADEEPVEEDPIVSCSFQDGRLDVYEERVFIKRKGSSKFSDKWIDIDQIDDVAYSKQIVISYIQIDQAEFENGEDGFISSPVDANTLHFGYGKRDCAKLARNEILERLAEETW